MFYLRESEVKLLATTELIYKPTSYDLLSNEADMRTLHY